jgi:hypothetical protein
MADWVGSILTAMSNGSGTAWAILLSATLAFIAVFVSGYLHRKTQRLVLTFQNQSSLLWDEDYQKYRKTFIEIRDGEQAKITAIAQKAAQATDDASAVRTIMNDYELVAIGIRLKILDENFLHSFSRKTTLLDFDKMKPYIDETRRINDNDAIYAEFEKLVTRWRNHKRPNRPANTHH